tara:strand:+ start:352 stop:657 length:306 start_codon:yes stop_codon:yes gene_type:complete
MKKISYGKQFTEDELVGNRVSNEDQLKLLKTVDELMKTPKKNKFGANTEEDLNVSLARMNTIEMQRLCIDVGVSPAGTRPFVKRKLVSEFKKFIRNNPPKK